MATGPRYAVRFRRRRGKQTDYLARLALLKSGIPRLVIRKTNTSIVCQFVKDSENGDKTVVGVKSEKLKSYGWKHSFKNLPAAYLSGYLVGKLAKAAKVTHAVLDLGLQSRKNSKLFSALKGAVDAGVEIPHDKSAIPDEKRIRGEHIKENLSKDFEATKKKIDSNGK